MSIEASGQFEAKSLFARGFAELLVIDSRLDESAEERMRTVRTGFEFRMRLGRDEERMILEFHHLDDAVIRREADRN